MRFEAEHVVVATGSAPSMLPIEGLEDVDVWTNREATTAREVPERAVIIGGPNGIETSQWLSRMGCRVTLVQSPNRLIDREDPKVGEIIQEVLEEEGIEVRVGRKVEQARRESDGSTVATLDDGEEVETDVLVMVAGRIPRVEGIGLESLEIEANENGLSVDERCQVERISLAYGGSGMLPASCPSRTWPNTRGASWPTTSSAKTAERITAASPRWYSRTRSLPPQV